MVRRFAFDSTDELIAADITVIVGVVGERGL